MNSWIYAMIDWCQRSSLTFSETLCAVFIPFIGIVEALVFTFTSCFDFQSPRNKKKHSSTFDDILTLAEDSPCSLFFLLHFIFRCFCLCCWGNVDASFKLLISVWQLVLMKSRPCVSCSRSWVVLSLMMASSTR